MKAVHNETSLWSLCSCGAVKRASRQLGRLYDEALAPAGLRSTQYTLLTQILLSGAPALRQLAGALVMDLSALGHTLKPLIRDGLVTVDPDPSDRRVKRARLTALGKAKQQEGQASWIGAQRGVDAIIGDGEAGQMREMLNAVSSPEFAKQFRARVCAAPAEISAPIKRRGRDLAS
jgi:DNA-binding MarR family transcriptional regulator